MVETGLKSKHQFNLRAIYALTRNGGYNSNIDLRSLQYGLFGEERT